MEDPLPILVAKSRMFPPAGPGEAGLAEGSYQAIRVHLRTFASLSAAAPGLSSEVLPGLRVSHRAASS